MWGRLNFYFYNKEWLPLNNCSFCFIQQNGLVIFNSQFTSTHNNLLYNEKSKN